MALMPSQIELGGVFCSLQAERLRLVLRDKELQKPSPHGPLSEGLGTGKSGLCSWAQYFWKPLTNGKVAKVSLKEKWALYSCQEQTQTEKNKKN